MADIHIDDFFHDCANAIIRLHSSFPRLTSLYVDDIIGHFETDEFGIPSQRHQACFDALLWLSAEGYIRYHDRVRQEGLDQVVLTEKSFLRLNSSLPFEPETSIPLSVARKRATLAWELKRALKDGSSDTLRQIILRFLQ